jgi:hypothetical protein
MMTKMNLLDELPDDDARLWLDLIRLALDIYGPQAAMRAWRLSPLPQVDHQNGGRNHV